jgi:endonuclease YncB( thermonuclease family)
MIRRLGQVLAAALLCAGATGSLLAGCDATAEPTGAATAAPTAMSASPGRSLTPSTAAAVGTEGLRPTGPTETAKVVRIVDGDTIVVRLGGRDVHLRYIGMDTPETVKPDTPVQWMGPEASAANARLVEGRTVVLEKDVSETDRYGRLLRYVWLHDGDRWTMVDLELVRLGYAQVETDPPDVRYADLFVAAQRAARAAGVGLWAPRPSTVP